MGCACSKASQASQPGHDQDLPRLKLGAATTGDASSSWQREGGASKASGSEVHKTKSSEDSPPPQRSEGDAASSSGSQGCGLDQTQSAEIQPQPEAHEALRPTVEDFGVMSSFCFCCPESQKPWEAELLQVSAVLKEKLQDPHFVAMRCDLDSSGDLDAHELKQAARVFGMKLSAAELQDLMAGQQRITKEQFEQIVNDFQKRPESAQSQRVVPHSLRGMALCQLEHLEELFVKSGWLARQCDSFNQDNAEAILAGEKFQQAPNLYALDTYVVTPMSKPGWCAARDQDSNRSIPWAVLQSSFSELLNPHGLLVHIFVSHFWGHLYSSTLLALQLWAMKHFPNFAMQPQSVVCWICLFALNQHAVADEVGEKPMQGPFNAALAQAAGGAVMVLDENVNPFKRIWCLFETWRLRDLQRPFRLICDLGSLSGAAGLVRGSPAEQTKMQQATCEALWSMSASKAQSSVAADKYRIWAHIAGSDHENTIKSIGAEDFFSEMTEAGLDLDAVHFSDFNRHMRSLLSTSLLETLLGSSDFTAAARCCLHGASLSEEQLEMLWANFACEDDRASWLVQMLELTAETGNASLLHCLLRQGAEAGLYLNSDGMTKLLHLGAQSGSESVVKLLLEMGVDARGTNPDGETALMKAAVSGHDPTVKLLLENGADPSTADYRGLTALIHAAFCGHEPVVKLLLEHGADAGVMILTIAAKSGHDRVVKLLLEHGTDAGASSSDGDTALMSAAFEGHEPVVKLLLEHGADARASSNDGETALMEAAQKGHEPVVKLLLENGADARAASNDGDTALMKAAQNGHEHVVKLLLERGADARAADNNGVTAVMSAASGGHEPVVKLLLEHGADAGAASNGGVTALMFAAQNGHEPVVKLLLEDGADAGAASNGGVTALMIAAQNCNEPVLKLLLDHGADARAARENGETALMQAAGRGHDRVVKLLLEHGADARVARNDGVSTLMQAAAGGHELAVKLLLEHGADVMAADNYGRTAPAAAAFGGHESVLALLLQHASA